MRSDMRKKIDLLFAHEKVAMRSIICSHDQRMLRSHANLLALTGSRHAQTTTYKNIYASIAGAQTHTTIAQLAEQLIHRVRRAPFFIQQGRRGRDSEAFSLSRRN
jgi:hypothetical protein